MPLAAELCNVRHLDDHHREDFMRRQEKAVRFTLLADSIKTICRGCWEGAPSFEVAGSWFHTLKTDGTYGSVPAPAGMMQPCAAAAVLTQMKKLKRS